MKYLIVTDQNYLTVIAEIKDYYKFGGGFGVDYKLASPEVRELVENFITKMQSSDGRRGLNVLH